MNNSYSYRWPAALAFSSVALNCLGVTYLRWVYISFNVPHIGLEEMFRPAFILIFVIDIVEAASLPLLVVWVLRARGQSSRTLDRIWITFCVVNLAAFAIAVYLVNQPVKRMAQGAPLAYATMKQ